MILSDIQILENVATIMAMIYVSFFLFTNPFTNDFLNKCFKALVIVVCVELVLFDLELVTATWIVPSMLRTIFSLCGYIIRPIMIILLIVINLRTFDLKKYFWVFIPELVNVFVSGSALFCKAAFYYDETNEFIRGPLGYTPHIVMIIYLLILSGLSFARRREEEELEVWVIMFQCVFVILGMVSDTALFTDGFIRINFPLGIMFYYLYFTTMVSRKDPLTECLNRGSFFKDCKRFEKRITGIISLDMNNLKVINDNRGHAAGDDALKKATEIMRKYIVRDASLYRIGGDEFMIMGFFEARDDIPVMAEEIKKAFVGTDYACAVGFCQKEEGMTIEEVINAADKNMYADKALIKSGSSYII